MKIDDAVNNILHKDNRNTVLANGLGPDITQLWIDIRKKKFTIHLKGVHLYRDIILEELQLRLQRVNGSQFEVH